LLTVDHVTFVFVRIMDKNTTNPCVLQIFFA